MVGGQIEIMKKYLNIYKNSDIRKTCGIHSAIYYLVFGII